MRTPTITLTKPRSFRLPPRAETRARLPAVAAKLREMQVPLDQFHASVQRMRNEIDDLRAQLQGAQKVNAEKAHREERVKAVTIRIVDRRADWEAKMGYKQQQPLVCLTGQRIVTADVWTQPQADE